MSLRKFLPGIGTKNVLALLCLLALLLWCSMLGSSVRAQTNSDQPMDSTALTALVAELREVVAKATPDPKEAASVSARWDKRTDLAGKTKKEVINLLFGDVRAVIKDSGTLYQIYSIFAFYKRMPDDSQPAAPPRGGNMYEEPWLPAARFAISEGGKKEKATITLLKVENANFQTGEEEGLTFQLCLAVDVQKGSKKAVKRYARTTVFRNDKINDQAMAYSLKSWALSKTLPPDCH
jgi:hypothetical protein